MKKLYIFLFFAVALVGGAEGQQPFAPVGAKWHYTETSMASNDIYYTWFESVKDTIVINQACRKIIGRSGCAWNTDYLFDRNDSVFFFNSNTQQFELLYNFAADVGDSWTIHHPIDWGGDNDSTTLTVDSTDNIVIDGVVLKVLYTKTVNGGHNNWWHFQGKHIQRIGAPYLFPVFGGCDPMPGSLRCYQDSEIFYKQTEYECDYVSSVIAATDNIISIYPNPVEDILSILVSGDLTDVEVQLFSADGQLIFQRSVISKIETINLSSLSLGVYYVNVKLSHNNNYYRILKL